MSLFKILKGDSARVGVDVTPFHDGYAYFTPDDGGFYIDSEDDGVQRGIRINPDEVEMSQVTGLDTALEAKADEADLTAHTGNTNNPHSVTAAQVGARPNTWTPSATDVGADPAGTATSAVNTHNQAQNAHSALFSAKANASDLTAHVDNTSNPHGVTAAQVGAATTALYTATLTAAGWTASDTLYSQTVAVSGLLDSDTPFVEIVQTGDEATDQAMRAAWAMVARVTASSGSITAWIGKIPSVDIPIQIKVVR